MGVFSQVVVGLASLKKEMKPVFVLIIPYWTFMSLSSITPLGGSTPMTFLHNATVFLSVLL
ncbi:hypothetical protein EJ576_22480 [Pseudomonas sp. C 49-2]|uniref:hypothetical protein n=1 Tax=Pseudomonas TaxID=286 RepID=UPI000F8197DD|nr:hypothetical protein [Pseudomonas sp. C 49-2]RTX95660.1 hypothetical protein EJ576_22480 [Pseudomonas sp. C 49-2]